MDEKQPENVLVKALSEIIYGHNREPRSDEVGIGSHAWLNAAKHVGDEYPALAEIMRNVEAEEHLDSPERERRLEADLETLDDNNDLKWA